MQRLLHSSPHAWLAVHPDIKGHEGIILEALLGCTDYGVLITQLASRQDVMCNARFGEIFGLSPDEIVNEDPQKVRMRVLPRMRDPDRFLEDLQFVYSQPDLEWVDELELIAPAQTIRRHTAPLRGVDGSFLGRVWTFLDITPFKLLQRELDQNVQQLENRVEEHTGEVLRLQEQLLTVEKVNAVGAMASAVAYDLRNILTPLMIELSTISFPDEEAALLLKRPMQRVLALTHQMLSITPPPQLQVSPMDLRGVWRSIEPLVRAQIEQDLCRLEVHLPEAPLPVEVNRDQIEHVFIHLALNAIAAMPDSVGLLTVKMESKDGSVLCHFTDTGSGIPEDVLPSLFEPFTSGRLGGTGLGLYNCRRILQDHGGNIDLESYTPGNTRFNLRLPLAALTHEKPMGSDGPAPQIGGDTR